MTKKDTHSIEVSTFCRALQLPGTAPVIHLRRHGESLVWRWSDPLVFHFVLSQIYKKERYERRYSRGIDTFVRMGLRTSIVAGQNQFALDFGPSVWVVPFHNTHIFEVFINE